MPIANFRFLIELPKLIWISTWLDFNRQSKIGNNDMLFPIADDNQDRTSTPIVNYMLIAINILVFVFLQGLGSNDRFTYAFSTVPAEIVTGRDIVTRDRVLTQPVTGQQVEIPGLQPTPIPVWLKPYLHPRCYNRVRSRSAS